MAAFFALAFFVNGIVLPYFPVLLHERGLTGDEIAVVLALPYLGRIVSMPLVTALADRVGDRRVVVAGVTTAMLAAGIAFGPLTAAGPVMAVGALILVLNVSLGPIADSIAVSMQQRGVGDYGRMRLWGSVTFILGNLIGGAVLQHLGAPAVYAAILVGFAIATAATVIIPPAAPARAVTEVASLLVLRRPAFLAVLAAGAFIQASHAALFGFATLTWQARGYGDMTIGAFWAIGVIAEIVLFALAWRLPGALRPTVLIAIGGLIGIARWALFTSDLGLVTTAALQAMHAGSFAIAHIGIMRFIGETVPEQKAASAQGTYVIMVGVAMAASTAVAGRLWTLFGDDMFGVMSLFCAVGLGILLIGRSGASRLPSVVPRPA